MGKLFAGWTSMGNVTVAPGREGGRGGKEEGGGGEGEERGSVGGVGGEKRVE